MKKRTLICLIFIVSFSFSFSNEVKTFLNKKDKIIKILKDNKEEVQKFGYYNENYFEHLKKEYPNDLIEVTKKVILSYSYSLLKDKVVDNDIDKFIQKIDLEIKELEKNETGKNIQEINKIAEREQLLKLKTRFSEINSYQKYFDSIKKEFNNHKSEINLIFQEIAQN